MAAYGQNPAATVEVGERKASDFMNDIQKTKVARKTKRPEAARFRFGYLVHDVSRTRRTLIDHWMKPLGITRAQWLLLSALARSGNDGMMQDDLARLLEAGKVTIGGLLAHLESSGHVERRPEPEERQPRV